MSVSMSPRLAANGDGFVPVAAFRGSSALANVQQPNRITNVQPLFVQPP